jgi:hypothetical protein
MTENAPVRKVNHPMLDPIRAMHMKKGKIVTTEEAIQLIRDGNTIVVNSTSKCTTESLTEHLMGRLVV